MTPYELAQFAAEKVGLEHGIGVAEVYPIEIDSMVQFLDLTSPDLFFKGLAVAYNECSTTIYTDDVLMQKGEREAIRAFNNIHEIPQKFWECWYEIEKGI